jgi:hypothetical protein
MSSVEQCKDAAKPPFNFGITTGMWSYIQAGIRYRSMTGTGIDCTQQVTQQTAGPI